MYLHIKGPFFCPSVDHCLFVSFLFDTSSITTLAMYDKVDPSRKPGQQEASDRWTGDEMNPGLWLQQPIGIPPNYREFPEATQETGAGRCSYFSPLGTRLVRHQSALSNWDPHIKGNPLLCYTLSHSWGRWASAAALDWCIIATGIRTGSKHSIRETRQTGWGRAVLWVT